MLAFSDGVYAIATTLLVLSIDLPDLGDSGSASEMLDQLSGRYPQIISFVISFAVIGRYWVAHHHFFARLKALDSGLIALNLVSLGVIAFLPFPTDVLGNYFENPTSIVFYALTIVAVSGLEVAMFSRAHRRRLLVPELTEDVYRWERAAQLAPVVFFCLSLPFAFVHPVLACLLWFGGVPFQALYLNPRKPAGVDTVHG